MQYFEAFSKLFSFLTQAIKLLQKKYYIGEMLDFKDIHVDYYPDSMDNKKMFAYKVSSIPSESHMTRRRALTFTLINKSEKPIKVVSAHIEGRKKEILALDAFTSELPIILDAHIGELQVSVVVDQLWAFAMYEDQRFTHTFSSLFFIDNLKLNIESIVFKLNDGTTIRHKLSKNILAEVQKVFNPRPKITQIPTQETKCSVDECSNRADYIVLLYDHYPNGTIFYEQDFTCPFLCETHMQENERGIGNKGVGKRRFPREHNSYLYSNRYDAQGYTKYLPLDQEDLLYKSA